MATGLRAALGFGAMVGCFAVVSVASGQPGQSDLGSAGGMASFSVSGSGRRLTERVYFGRNLNLGTILDGTVRPDGSVCVVEYQTARIVCLSDEGKLLFAFGRKGQGPSEFEIPYRIASSGSGALLVYDLGSRAVTLVGSDGTYISRRILPIAFSQVNNLQVLDSLGIVIADE